MSFEIVMAQARGTFPEYMRRKHGAVATAMTRAMTDTTANLQKDARASIGDAGFPKGMMKALRTRRYPVKGESIEPAAFLWHRSNYTGLFEYGGTIRGNPLLWLPLSTTPPKLNRQKSSPSLFASKGVNLVSMKSAKGTPLLGAPVRLLKSGAVGKVTWSKIKRGKTEGEPFTTIPLFHGVRTVTQPKRFAITAAGEKAASGLPSLFVRYYKDP